MRGSPLIRAFFAFCLIAALGWPLWRLTHPTEAAAASVVRPQVASKDIDLQLDFTVLPKAFAVRHLEKDVWQDSSPQISMERKIALPFPPQGIDLVFHIEWADDATLSAVRVRLTDPAGDTHEKSVWGKGAVDEVLTFP